MPLDNIISEYFWLLGMIYVTILVWDFAMSNESALFFLEKDNGNIPDDKFWSILTNLKFVIFKLISTIDILSIPCEIALSWMSQNLTADKLTLVEVMAWCHQAILGQYWQRSLLACGFTRPQWVNENDFLENWTLFHQ